MKLFIRREEDIITSTVEAFGEEFSKFIQYRGHIIKTSDGREFITLPYVFERVDSSDVYIIRRPNTKFIKKEILEELKNSLE